ncbi:MAG: hypothetical protein RIK87_08450 [Fuerstiella sp.]
MVDLLKLGSDLLEKTLEANASQQIVFEKIDTKEEATLLAIIGGSSADAQENLNLRADFDSQDFIIRRATPVTLVPAPVGVLTFGDWLAREPKQNDRIRWNGLVYIVSPVFGNEAWRYTDGYHTSYRLHTKRIGTSA